MTENSRKVLETLKANYGKKWVTSELAEAAGVSIPTVTGAVTGMAKKGYAVREEGVINTTDKEGKEIEKVVKFISLTEAGLNFDPDAKVEENQ